MAFFSLEGGNNTITTIRKIFGLFCHEKNNNAVTKL